MICKFNFFSIKTTSLVLLSTFSSNLTAKLPEAPNLFKEWVTTERMISKESSNWDTEKEAIDDPDLTDNGSGNRIINISTRGFAGTGDYEDLVGGFVLKGPAGGRKDFIMRGLGPYMKLTTSKDIYLTDPFMTVEKGQTVIGSSDDWATKYSANDPEPSTTLNNGNYSPYTTGWAGVGLQEKEAGLLMEMEIDSSIGFGIYTNTVKYSAP